MLSRIFTTKNHYYQEQDIEQETIDILRLIRSENVGPKTFHQLIKIFGSATKALEHIPELSIKGGKKKPISVFSASEAYQELEMLAKHNARLLTYKSLSYPKLLLETEDFPPIIYYKGQVNLLNNKTLVAIVGARNSSINARHFARKVAYDLSIENITTVSGLAKGIDTEVHIGSNKNTIGVIAGGIDHIYPIENKYLFDKMSTESLIIAELPIGCKPLSQHFPQRNRIIAGVSLATVVIEAGLHSGSLITANFAIANNREIFVAPGFPLEPRSMGSNKLIKEGAYLLENAEDIINVLKNMNLSKVSEYNINDNNFNILSNRTIVSLTDEHRKTVIKAISVEPTALEAIADDTSLPLQLIQSVCLELELAGRLIRYPANKVGLIYKLY